jgi:hypothetical protein
MGLSAAVEPVTLRGAIFSPDRTYRYVLKRVWQSRQPSLVVIGLNPSTADERLDDPTIRRCQGYARLWGYGGLVMLNLFGLRSTDPKALYQHDAPIGPDNDVHIQSECFRQPGSRVLVAWGTHGAWMQRGWDVGKLLVPHPDVQCLDVTLYGQPKHPLYLPKLQPPRPWTYTSIKEAASHA